MKKSPGTSGLMPVKGSGCGIRPDIEKMEDSEGFDFSGAAELLDASANEQPSSENITDQRSPQHEQAQNPASRSKDQSSPEPQD